MEHNEEYSEISNNKKIEIQICQQSLVKKESQNIQNDVEIINYQQKLQQLNETTLFLQNLTIGSACLLSLYLIPPNLTIQAFGLGILAYTCYLGHQINQNQQRVENVQDWERLFGLEKFEEENGQSYTQEDLDCVFKQMKIFWNPNKKKTEQKKDFAIKRLQQLEKAYENIKKYHNWQ
ncbi:hypothetical protein ABPG74_000887 [Tetrahymena malaccensis]